MKRETIMKVYNCDYSTACIISNIMTVKEFNKGCSRPEDKVKFKTGYVMPIYHGYQYSSSKKKLINQFTFLNL